MALLKFQIAALILASAPMVLAQDNATEPPARIEAAAGPSAIVTAQYTPLTLSGRYRWVALNTLSAPRWAGYSISSAWSTMTNAPEEYGPHWDGFAKRVGMRVAVGATGSMMEASLGALWDEDPRYVRAAGQPFKKRVLNVAKMTFLARNRNGELMPAYARYISIPTNSYLSNAWRADSEADGRHAAIRIPMSFLTRAIGNAFTEFWPDATKLWHRDPD
ncbi:MAG: hypothetical protein JWO19_3742 [Bryobacterales bacterium]|nr:hypothetical protein [Bryobacterales bacterium]